MKNKRNTIANLLKMGVFLFGVSLLLWNCEDDKTEGLTEVELYKQTSLVNTKLVSQKLGLGENNIFIRWDKPTILVLDKKNQGGVYQYDIEQKEPVSNNSNLFVDKLTFKLIVREKEGAIEDVQIYRYEPFKESLNTAPSEIAKEGFSGMKFIFNELAELEDIYTYKLGKKISTFNETKSERIDKHKNILYPKMDDSEFDSCLDLNGKQLEGCNNGGGSGSGSGGGYVTETTRHYTDWYNRCDSCTSNDGKIYNYGGINYIYVHTKYNGSTTRWVWVSSGGDRYVDVYNSNSPSGGGPAYDGEDREYSSGGGNNGYELPCPIGFEKVGDNCVKIVESYDDRIINEIKDEKIKCLHDKLTKDGNTFVKDLLANFEGVSEFNINISSVDKIFSANVNDYVNGETSYKKGDNMIYIKISANKISNNSVLSGIRTILHEYIHADMFRKLYTKEGISNSDIKDFKETYNKFKSENFKPNNLQHETMAKLYVNSMAAALKEVHQAILLREYNYLSQDGAKSLDNLYEALAWQGLKGHDVQAYTELSDTKKKALKEALDTYFYSLTKNCPQ